MGGRNPYDRALQDLLASRTATPELNEARLTDETRGPKAPRPPHGPAPWRPPHDDDTRGSQE